MDLIHTTDFLLRFSCLGWISAPSIVSFTGTLTSYLVYLISFTKMLFFSSPSSSLPYILSFCEWADDMDPRGRRPTFESNLDMNICKHVPNTFITPLWAFVRLSSKPQDLSYFDFSLSWWGVVILHGISIRLWQLFSRVSFKRCLYIKQS